MQKRLWHLALVVAILMGSSVAWADDDFYVIAGGRGVGTRITSLPYTISNSGFYYLGGDLTTSGEGITVDANHVTIDLMGFSLIRSGTPGGNGIYMAHRTNVEIRNGTVRGFDSGVYGESGTDNTDLRVINVRAIGNQTFGIGLFGSNHLVRGCHSSNNQMGIFIYSGTIANSTACDNSFLGIEIDGPGSLLGNVANNNTNHNFWVSNSSNVLVDRNSASGLATNYSAGCANTAWGVNAGRP